MLPDRKILVTGGAGFIGSALIRYLLQNTNYEVLNVDKLTYAGNLESLSEISNHNRYKFTCTDIVNFEEIENLFNTFQPDLVMHLAAESHVDRSIDGPKDFIQTNIIGTYNLLEASLKYIKKLKPNKKQLFRFHHISTDEVYGDLGDVDELFTENSAYAPSSPYSASKASSDHLVRAWHRTFNLPIIITNCSNNYGPYQFPEKLIPLVILNSIEGKPIPIYGNGQQTRDWLYVEDHVKALLRVALNGKLGETYNIGGFNEKKNIDVVEKICEILDRKIPIRSNDKKSYKDLISYVPDRAGHDIRYAIDARKISEELNWKPEETFESGIEKTINWYLQNQSWCKSVQDGSYMRERLGLKRNE